jgi:hypothetical protein
MFRTAPGAEPASVVMASPPSEPVPLSVLELDLPAPTTGWVAYLTERHIPILTDDLGRSAIRRDDARELLTEHREQREATEARKREALARQEQAAIEADKQFRAQLARGLPWYEIPDGVTAAEAWRPADLAAQPKRKSLLEEALSNSGTLTYHALPSASEDES